MKEKIGAPPGIAMVKIQELVDFGLLDEVLSGVPRFRDLVLLSKILQDGVAFGKTKTVISIDDCGNLFHGVDFLKLLSAILGESRATSNLKMRVSMTSWGMLEMMQSASTALAG